MRLTNDPAAIRRIVPTGFVFIGCFAERGIAKLAAALRHIDDFGPSRNILVGNLIEIREIGSTEQVATQQPMDFFVMNRTKAFRIMIRFEYATFELKMQRKQMMPVREARGRTADKARSWRAAIQPLKFVTRACEPGPPYGFCLCPDIKIVDLGQSCNERITLNAFRCASAPVIEVDVGRYGAHPAKRDKPRRDAVLQADFKTRPTVPDHSIDKNNRDTLPARQNVSLENCAIFRRNWRESVNNQVKDKHYNIPKAFM